jgi:hypothetical protein
MTEPQAVNQKNAVVVCLVTDKKYRKMGGDEGLKAAIKRRASGKDMPFIGQVLVEDLLKVTTETTIDDNFFKIIKTDFGFDETKQVILIHKYSDYFKSPRISRDQGMKLRNWLCNCTFKVRDDPEKIDVLSCRVKTGMLVREMCRIQGFESRGLQWPEFELKWIGKEMEYPVIVKPIDACASDEAHWMTLLNEYSESFDSHLNFADSCLVQKFHEHFGVLYKVYVIGDIVEIIARPSITSREAGSIMRFNTHKFKAAEGELNADKWQEAMMRLENVRELVEEFAKELKKKLQLTWFGIDVIIPEVAEGAGLRAAVIDVNYMPGYDGIKDLAEKLIKAVLE